MRIPSCGPIPIAMLLSVVCASVGATPGGDPWAACSEAVADAERAAGIPRHLLHAISLAESGRHNAANRERLAWPWTVMAERKGKFFPTKEAAIAHVEVLRARGVRNIDVGCMQVNLKYHPDAFADLDAAFDPATNTAYAARYLEDLRRETGSWPAAAGRYHSATPGYEVPYRAKVVQIWNERRRTANAEPEAPTTTKAETRVAAKDKRKALRRSRPVPVARALRRPRVLFSARGGMAVKRNAKAKARFAANRIKQLAAWRQGRR